MDFVKRFRSLPIKTRQMMSLAIVLALFLALPLFIWSIINLNFNQKEKAASGEPVDITLGEPIIGLSDAPVTIVVYSDFQCPFCKSFVDNTMSTILANYPTEVKLVFKDFPLLTIHPLAERAAFAGQCAFNQDKFWEMHDLLFEKQETLTESDFFDFANQLNLDLTAFSSCYNNRTVLEEVQDDMTEGMFKEVNGTPTFFINGTRLDGALPFESFQTIIDEKLALLATQSPTSMATSTTLAQATPTITATPTTTPTSAPEEPNNCGGTCGSNYNCKANLYCYKGFCRNPICSEETDCNCTPITATPTATSKVVTKSTTSVTTTSKTATPKSTAKASPKSTPNYTGGMTLIEKADELARDEEVVTSEPENMIINKYAIYIVAGFGLIVLAVIIYALKKKRDNNIPHIVPPTNI